MIKVCGVHFANFISFNFAYSDNSDSLRPNYFIFVGYLKTECGEGGSSEAPEPPIDLPLIPPLLKT